MVVMGRPRSEGEDARGDRTTPLAASRRGRWWVRGCLSCSLLVALSLSLMGRRAWGSASGLDNIPTTDYVPPKVLVLQTWLNVADDQDPQQFVGFKYGVVEGLEIGADWQAYGETHGHAIFEAKYTFPLLSEVWLGVVGIANLSAHRSHQGEPFPYVATSYDLGLFRTHLGYAPQKDNEAFFAGLDRTIPFLGRDLQLKADVIQTNNSNDALYSAGFLYNFRRRDDPGRAAAPGLGGTLYALTRNFILESWVSKPSTGTSDDEILTVKLNYVIEF